jgi:lipopolysaccharide/colanic/teichoic acid biosynthesis glycosyltransferase
VAAALGLIAFLAPVLAGIALASYRPGAPLILRRHRVLPYGRRVAVFEFSTAGPTGRYLRLFRGDQLPQLFSVLRGELSIFGDPSRPHLFAD